MNEVKKPIRVIQLIRKPQKGFHSFERLFSQIRQELPSDIEARVVHSWFHSRGFFPRLLNLIQTFFLRADVYHITGDIHYLAMALVGRKTILTVHDLAPLRKSSGWRRKILELFWYRLPFRIVPEITTISETIKVEIIQEFDLKPDRIRVIPNCIDPRFTYSPKAWPEIPTVLMVGTRPQKNIERMAVALTGLNVKVRVIGTLNPKQEKVFADAKVPVSSTGPISDEEVIEVYRNSDLLAFASTYEGFGLPVIEAQATGRPVLTSNFGSMAEVAGKGGEGVNPFSIESIRAGIEKLLTEEIYRKHLMETGFRNARCFSPTKTATAYGNLYRKISASNS